MKKIFIILLVSSVLLSTITEAEKVKKYANEISDERMLLVLAAPSVNDEYYSAAFDFIVDFQIRYAKAVMGNDNVVIVVNEDTKKFYEGKIPEDILITGNIKDIWMMDFTTINPLNPVQFAYTTSSMWEEESSEVQNSFSEFADKYGIKRKYSDLYLDGGNIVDNYKGRIITTTRFMEDNNLSYEEAKKILKKTLNAKEAAIIEPDEEKLAHSDGMVCWIEENVLLVNDYSDDKTFRAGVIKELKKSFPSVKIIEVPVEFAENKSGEWEGFSSARGVNLNSVVTFKNVYVPVFDMKHDKKAVEIISKNTKKKVITINAKEISMMGGSVRCMTWQLTGKNAEKLILAAREK